MSLSPISEIRAFTSYSYISKKKQEKIDTALNILFSGKDKSSEEALSTILKNIHAKITKPSEVQKLLKAFAQIKPEERITIATETEKFLKRINNQFLVHAIPTLLSKMPKEKKVLTTAIVEQFEKKNNLELESITKVLLINALMDCNPEIMQSDIYCLKDFFIQDYDASQHWPCIDILILLAPEDRIPALCSKALLSSTTHSQFLTLLFYENNARAVRAHAHLQQKLIDCESDRENAIFWAKSIINHQECLQLLDNHPLFTKALEILTVANAQSSERKNPYTLYNTLTEIHQSEPLIDTLQLTFCEKKYTVNLKKLRALAQTRKKTTFSELQKTISYKEILSLFEALEKRVSEDKHLHTFIKQEYDKSFTELKQNITDKPLIKTLLSNKNRSENSATQPLIHLLNIVETLFLCSTARENDLLSEQEAFLLAFSRQIHNCSVGQKDGLFILNAMIMKKKGLPVLTTDLFESQIQDILYDCFDRSFQLCLTQERLISRLSKQTTVCELSNQTLFLLNRLCKQLALSHVHTFDLHTGVLYEELLDVSVSDTFNAINNHFSTFTLIREIQALFTNAENKTYNELYRLFEKVKEKPNDWQTKLMEFKDSGDFEGITVEGTLTLLKHFGIFYLTPEMKDLD